MIARRCCCSAISVLFQTTRPRSVLVSQHKQKNSSLLSSIDRSHFFFFVFFFERFFLYQNREDCAKAVLFFSSFLEKLLRKMDCFFVCSRPKKKNFRLQICPRGLPSSSRQPRIQNQRKLVRVCGIKFQFSLPLLKIITLLKRVLFNTRTRTAS